MKAGWDVVAKVLQDHKDGDTTMKDVVAVAEELEEVMKNCKLMVKW
jgi:hypothetical protein